MIRGGRERAVSVQIGAVLLLAILVTALSLYQVNAVPDENRGVEIDHHREVQTQLVDLRNGIVDTPHRGSAGSHSITLGTGYPSRSFTVNPPPATGTVRTVGTNDANYSVELVNATPADDDAARAWNENGQRYDTGAVGYRPRYNEFTDAPAVVYENSVLYNERGGNRAALTEQAIVDGTEITLVTIDGNYSQTGSGAAALDVSTVSASGNAIDLEAAGDGNVSLRVPTRLSVAAWERLLDGESAVLDVRLEAERDGFSVVEIVLDPDRTYELRMAKVGLGSDVDGEDESYLTVVDEPEDVTAGESTEMTVEVRDRYNNPVSGVRVNATADGSGTLDRNEGTTGSNGRLTFEYNATEAAETVYINASYAVDPGAVTTFDETRPENVSTSLTVREPSGDGGGGGSYDLAWNTTTIDRQAGIDCTASECKLDLERTNDTSLYVSTEPPVEGASVDYALEDPNGIATLDPTSGETNASGINATTFDPDSTGNVTAHVTGGGDGDSLPIEVVRSAFFAVSIENTNSPVSEGDDLNVTARVENTGGEPDTQDVEFDFGNDGTVDIVEDAVRLSPGEATEITFTYDTTGETQGEHDVSVSSDDDRNRTTVRIGTYAWVDVDDFERSALQYYSGNESYFETTTDLATNGTRSLFGEPTAQQREIIITSSPGDGLDYYPQRGDRIRLDMRLAHEKADGEFLFGGTGAVDTYGVRLNADDDYVALNLDGKGDGAGERLALENVNIQSGTWYEVDVQWGQNETDGTITVTVYAEDGTQVARISADDTTYDDGIVGYTGFGPNRGIYVDNVEAYTDT